METMSPQFMRLVAEIASKILRRVLSARAFDIFSSSERFILTLECSEVLGLTAIKQNCAFGNDFRKTCNQVLR